MLYQINRMSRRQVKQTETQFTRHEVGQHATDAQNRRGLSKIQVRINSPRMTDFCSHEYSSADIKKIINCEMEQEQIEKKLTIH